MSLLRPGSFMNRALVARFSPASLFAAGEQGAWYDPSDFLPNWRLNLLTWSEAFDNAAWVASITGVGTVTKSTTNAGEAPDGTTTADRVIFNLNGGTATTDIALLRQSNATTGDLTFSIAAKSFDGTSSYAMQIIKPDGTAQSITVTGTWQRFSVTGTASGAVNYGLRLRGGQTPTNSDTADVLLWGADLRLTSNASVSPTYQKITDGIQDYLTYQPQPVMFQDSAGTTPVTAVEQPVGLLLDKSKGLALGAELVTNGDFSGGSTGWTLGTGWTISGGVASFSAGAGAELIQTGRNFAANTTYKITFDMTQVSGGGFRFVVDTTGSFVSSYFTTTASHTLVFSVGATSTRLRLGALGGASFSVDNISIRELSGNHASQSTSASRPVLSARVNLLTYTEQFDNAAWTKTNVTVTANATTDPNGNVTADQLSTTAATTIFVIGQNVTVGAAATALIYAKANTTGFLQLTFNGETTSYFNFNLTSGVVGSSAGTVTGTIRSVGNGWYECIVNNSATTVTGITWGIVGSATATRRQTFTGTGAESVYIWGADLRVTNVGVGLPAYQRVAAATDYDPSGFPLYLSADGTDDSLATASIDFSATDKMTVVAGVRKLSDAAQGTVLELSASTAANNGTVALFAPPYLNGGYAMWSKGTVLSAGANTVSPLSPTTNVVTGTASISTDSSILRSNGVQIAADAADQGTGNYGNYPLFIGRRGGASLPFNGRIYGLVIRGAASTDEQISAMEKWMAAKTGITI